MKQVGCEQNFFLHEGYQARASVPSFDDTPFTDEFQAEVYLFAQRVLHREKLFGVLDVGCGSGYKLLHFFRDQPTLGLDCPATVDFLRRKYGDRAWRAVDLESLSPFVSPYEMAICSDVIEHLVNPNPLLDFLARCGARRIVLSTPQRDLLKAGTEDGPPHNIHHVREWNLRQFAAYLETRFRIIEHTVCKQQATQIALCAPR